MSYFKRQSDDSYPVRKPAAAAAKNWATQLIKNAHKAKLGIAAREAYNIQFEHGLTSGLNYDEWRHNETQVACGKSSFRDLTNSDFRGVLARFYRLAGREKEADELYAKTGRVKGSDQMGDTHENRELCRALIREKIASSNGAINDAYVATIVRNKHQGKTIQDLTAAELRKLVYTITARIAKKA